MNSQTGKAWLYLGGPSGLGAASWSAQGSGPNEYFGYAIAMSDLDGDGYSDVAISSEPSTFGANPGVRVYFGGPGGLSAQPGYTIVPSPPIAGFGGALAGVGDFDGDGVGDLVVGASEEGATGGIHLYLGSPGRALPSQSDRISAPPGRSRWATRSPGAAT